MDSIQQTTQKNILLGKVNLPHDLIKVIIRFAFQNLKEAKEQHERHNVFIRNEIAQCLSRLSTLNDEDEHWVFGKENSHQLRLQAINCSQCGEYLASESTPAEGTICFCRYHCHYRSRFEFDVNSDY